MMDIIEPTPQTVDALMKLDLASGVKFVNTVVGGNIPKEYIPGVEKGINFAAQNGVIAGYNVIDFEAEVHDGAFHDVDSSV